MPIQFHMARVQTEESEDKTTEKQTEKKTLRISIKVNERGKGFFICFEGRSGICGCVDCIRNLRRKHCRKHIRFEVEKEQKGMLESIEYK
jgi:hypothetical protein